jgi:hypothetical protein
MDARLRLREGGCHRMKVQGLWIGERLGIMEQICIQSYLANGHEFDLYAYDEIKDVPTGTAVLDAGSILSRSMIGQFRYAGSPSVSPFSNVFRFLLLLEKGGIWVDLDTVCLGPFHIDEEYCFPLTSGEIAIDPDPEFSVDSWFMKVQKGSKFIQYCYERALAHSGQEMSWGTIGPALVTEGVQRFDLSKYARDDIFFPINWNRMSLFIDGSNEAAEIWDRYGSKSYVLHLYNEVWRVNNIDKNASFSPISIYERLKNRHLAPSA